MPYLLLLPAGTDNMEADRPRSTKSGLWARWCCGVASVTVFIVDQSRAQGFCYATWLLADLSVKVISLTPTNLFHRLLMHVLLVTFVSQFYVLWAGTR